MSYTALYRKWRPKVFEEVVGQDHIIETIKAQIKNKNIPHAYLFSGTRGTGKTSTAKILSRAVNCLNPSDSNPCNECKICKGILDESIMDIIEIDAASNNGVDDIRELRENVKYPPSITKYKVYIIDEVHMLSSGAFNALLKTLEEPPESIIFILATTEPQKIPATILSRCQKFDFKRINSESLGKIVKKVCNDMNVSYEDEAIELITRNADGAARDVLSLLDKIISGQDDNLNYENTIKALGIIDDEFLIKMVESLINKNAKLVFELTEEFYQSGKNLNYFIKKLVYHFRNLLMCKSQVDVNLILKESKEYVDNLKNQVDSISTNEIIRDITIFSNLESSIKYSSQGRILFEIAMAKIMNPIFDFSEEGILSRIEELEKNKPISYIKEESSILKDNEESKINNIKKDIEDSGIIKDGIKNILKSKDFMNINDSWNGILSIVREKNVKVHAFLIEGRPVGIKDDKLILGFEDGFGFHIEMLLRSENKIVVENIISEQIGKPILIDCEFLSNIEDNISKTPDIEEDDISKINDFFGDMSSKINIIE